MVVKKQPLMLGQLSQELVLKLPPVRLGLFHGEQEEEEDVGLELELLKLAAGLDVQRVGGVVVVHEKAIQLRGRRC